MEGCKGVFSYETYFILKNLDSAQFGILSRQCFLKTVCVFSVKNSLKT